MCTRKKRLATLREAGVVVLAAWIALILAGAAWAHEPQNDPGDGSDPDPTINAETAAAQGMLVPTTGACCLTDGTCLDDLTEAECAFSDGVYQGDGTICDLVDCPIYGECGLVFTAPVSWADDTGQMEDSCDLRPSKDAQFEIILPYEAEWIFSVCEADWDTYLYLTASCCPPEGSPDIIAESDDHPDCNAASKIVKMLSAGTYYLTVEGFSSSDCGPFPLEIAAPCTVDCDPDSIPEGEPDCYDGYEDTYNLGCDDDGSHGYPFTPIACGDIVCGTAGTYSGDEGATRDTDWYEFDLSATSEVTWSAIAEFEVQIILIDPGPADCKDAQGEPTYTLLDIAVAPPCGVAELTLTMEPGETGTGWAWAGTHEFTGVPCGSIYNVHLSCDVIVPCDADITGADGVPDGMVDVLDLLLVLIQWGTAGPEADITGPEGLPDGVVDDLDLLEVIAMWGPCE